MVAGRHFFGAIDRNPSVHWVAYQDFLRASRNMESGVVNLTTWYTGSQCVSLPLRYSYDNTQSIFATVEHTRTRTYEDAITTWVETVSYRYGIRVCARELQNFDGIHEGIKIHWIAVSSNFLPFLTENRRTFFPGRYYSLGAAMPAVCKEIEYNLQYPVLPNPTVLLSGALSVGSSGNGFSNNDIAIWIEYAGMSHMKMCHKILTTYSQHYVKQGMSTLKVVAINIWRVALYTELR